jgi:LemA protein
MNLPEGLGWWIAAAVVVFWFVGAHNRLVRLRSTAMQAYAALDGALVRQLEFVQARIATQPEADGALRAATDQLTALLAATRLRPLDARAIAPLATALRVLLAAWARVYPDEVTSFDTDGTLSRPAPLDGSESAASARPMADEPMAWPEPSAVAEIARGQFNAAVANYNASIRQFPAFIVAWAFRLRPAAPLM